MSDTPHTPYIDGLLLEAQKDLERAALSWFSSPGLWRVKSSSLSDNGDCLILLERLSSGAEAHIKIPSPERKAV